MKQNENDTKKDETDIKQYVGDPTQSDVERGAAFLDWLARMHPGRAVPVPYIMKVANNLTKLPREDSEGVAVFRKTKITPTRKILFFKYKRMSKWVIGMGYRASYDWDDMIQKFFPKNRIKGALTAGNKVISIIPRDKLSKENQEIFDIYNKQLKAIQAPIGKILTAGEQDKDKDKEKK
jgi:hypothetical protein